MSVRSMAILGQDQQCWKAFVDRHQGRNEDFFEIGKAVLVFQTRMGRCPENSASNGQGRTG